MPVLEVGTDKPRPRIMSFGGADHPVLITSDLGEALRELCLQLQQTSFHLLLTVWKILLCAESVQEEVVVGVPYLGRESADV